MKAYIRKGRTQHFLKQYHKALVTYDAGLKVDPGNKDLLKDKSVTEYDPQRQQDAIKDPEIKRIFNDPVIKEVLANAGGKDPAAAQRSMQDPEIARRM